MTAVIRVRLNQAAAERLEAPLKRRDVRPIARWPIFASLIAAVLVSGALWAAIAWVALRLF